MPPTGRTLLFFGLIRGYKGLDVLVRALAEVPDARLVVAGDPLDPVEPIRALADELGVADRIDWRLGYLPQDEVERLMREATLAVFPYRGGESASGALATALGHGRPAVVSDVLGELVAEYGAGAVVPREDAARARRGDSGATRRPGRAGAGVSRHRGRPPCALLGRDRGGPRAALLRPPR